MSDFDIPRNLNFARACAPFSQRGGFPLSDLLPIIPPGAKLGSKSAVDPSQAGKVPGRYETRTGKWYGLTGNWPTSGLHPAAHKRAADWPTENVGLRAEAWPAVDIDVASDEARELVEGAAASYLGNAPARVRGNSPRVLLVYKRVGDDIVRKSRLVFRDHEGREHAVEVLGAGQQYLIAGTHPSGARYEWRPGADLATWRADGLTQIAPADVRKFLDFVAERVRKRGWEVARDVRTAASANDVGYVVADLEPLVPVEMALAALKSIPNDADAMPMREDLVRIMAGFKAAVGRDALRGDVERQVLDWATEHDWAEPKYAEQVWQSLRAVRVGPQVLFDAAHRYGFVGDARSDFADAVEDAEAVIEAAQKAGGEEAQKLQDLAKRIVYWPEAQKWIELATKRQFSHAAFNSCPGLGTMIAPAGSTGTRAAANKLLNASLVQQVQGITYLPGQPQLVTWDPHGRPNMFFNRWEDANVSLPDAVTDGNVRPWLDHAAYLFEEAGDREYLLDYLAHILQRRGRKIRWAPIIIGSQGIGKDLFLRPIMRGLGERTNCATVQPDRLQGKFIDFYERELVVVEEITRTERNDVYERLKAIISGTASDTVLIERKFEQPYEVPNTVNFVFFSNHSDALSLSADDRRFFVISSHASPADTAYYTRLSRFYESGGWQAVVRWLRQRDIGSFNPDARPRFNSDKEHMIEQAQPYYALWLRDEFLPDRSVVTVKEVLDTVATNLNINPRVRDHLRGQSQVAKALKFAGWVYRHKELRLHTGQQARVWCRNEQIANSSLDLIRAAYQRETVGKGFAKMA